MKEVVIICGLIYDNSNKIFLITSYKWKGYGLPGGKQNPGESEESTLKREIKEELGIEITDLVKSEEIISPPTKNIDNITTFIVKPYFAKAVTTNINPNEEVENYGWYSIDKALKLELLEPIRKTIELYKQSISPK